VAVIYQGRIVEQGSPTTLFREAAHPYTRALLAAVPRVATTSPAGRNRPLLIAPRLHPITACPYAARCPQAQAVCDAQRPELSTLGRDHQVACHFGASNAPLS
jgi:peptide/nickel transport system ATP-binding protein